MTGVTIDHMVSLVLLITVLTVSMVAYSQIIGVAFSYQQNHQVSMKAAELANALLLSPGDPIDWGSSNRTPLAFGLQDSEAGGYSLDAFSLSRLLSPKALVYYYKTGLWYSNNSLGGGGTLLVPMTNAINYTTAANLLGVNGSYAFRLTVTPTLNVSISEVNLNPLRLKVETRGLGLVVRGATLNYFLYYAIPQGGQYPSFQTFSGTSQTNSTGSTMLEFPSVDGSQYAYSMMVYAHLGGLSGVGYHSRESLTDNKIVPFIEDFANRVVLLAHSWDVQNFPPPVAALHFNATFMSLSENFELREVPLISSSGFDNSGIVNYGEGYPYARVQIPTQSAGILIVAYRWGSSLGIVMMPWGISSLGFTTTFGGNLGGTDWVATELRQVTVNRISYQVNVAVWSIKGYQPWRYNL